MRIWADSAKQAVAQSQERQIAETPQERSTKVGRKE